MRKYKEHIMEEKMFFGKKLKELRLKSKKGLRNFSLETKIKTSTYSNIELGYEKFEDVAIYDRIKDSFTEDVSTEDIRKLDELFEAPFVMQKMPEPFMPSPFIHKSDGEKLTEDELMGLIDYVNTITKEHNEKADAYNNAHGVT